MLLLLCTPVNANQKTWGDHEVETDLTVGGNTISGTLSISGESLFSDKIKFTQTDGNEYIDSLNDGYMDYGATTEHRFLTAPVSIANNTASTTYATGALLVTGGVGVGERISAGNGAGLGDGGATNYVDISGDGVMTFEGLARFWQGVVLDTSRFKEPTSQSATLVNRGIGTAYSFTKDQEAEHIHLQVSVPGFWDVTEDLEFILIWDSPATSDDCDWEIHYQFLADDAPMDSVTYDGVANSVSATSSATSKGLVHSIVIIPTAAFDTGDKVIRFGVYRDGVTDSIDDDCFLHGIRLRGVRYKTGGATT